MSEKEPSTQGEPPERGRIPEGASCEERLAELIEVAARVRHEINNPLTGLLGQAQLLLREELSDAARRRVLTIEHLAQRIRDAAAELRNFQRQNQPFKPEPETGEPPRH